MNSSATEQREKFEADIEIVKTPLSHDKNFLPGGLRNDRFRAILVREHGKEPVEKEWAFKRNYNFDDPIINNWIIAGGNWGITFPRGDACAVDGDTKDIVDALNEKLPTYAYSTGRSGHFQFIYAIEDTPIGNIPLTGGAYIKGKGGFVVGPGSYHPNGVMYGEIKSGMDVLIVFQKELLEVLEPFLVRKKEPKRAQTVKPNNVNWISIADLIDLSKFRKSGNQFQGRQPIHGSETGLNLSVDLERNLWHCFRHDSGGSVLEWIAVQERIIDCGEAVPGALRGSKFWQVIEVAHSKYGLTKETAVKMIKGGPGR